MAHVAVDRHPGLTSARDAQLARPAAGDDAPALVARDLWLAYDRASYVLQGVSVQVRRGAMTMILGRSGSGKTSLLKVLAGLLRPQRGTVDVLDFSPGKSGRGPSKRVAYIPQTLGLVRSMTALENALVGALSTTSTLRSLLKAFPRRTVEDAKATLGRLGLAHKLQEKVYNLSGGERQRVAIARALLQRPELILADEFVSQLDPVTTEETLNLMREIADSGVSLLITTHETDVVANYADQLLVVQGGRLAYDGGATDLPIGAMKDLLR